ncbi:MAG TPA: copper amine oxidase N-terminal domain-containing protein [Candidatus Agathobaculum merdigallinarum]|nr:copper amine oxidase N-terminal domain-containing protein [Candidatus Agathobaculum merdigallinarum]
MRRKIALLLAAAMLSIIPYAAAAGEQPLAEGEVTPYRTEEQAVITDVQTSLHEGDITLVTAITVQTDTYDALTLRLKESTFLADAADGSLRRMTDVVSPDKLLQKGDTILVTYGTTIQQSESAQTDAELVVVHPGEGTTPHLLDAEVVYRDLTARFLANNGSLLVNVDRETPVQTLYGEEETNARIRMGTRLVAWYDIVLTSYPGQTAPEKVVLLPDQDRDFTIITEGDIAVAEGRIENGVAMVPVRKVAEALGYTVTWNGAEQSVRLARDDAEMTIQLGEDRYAFGNAREGLSFGAASYVINGVSWVPAEVFTLLGHEQQALTGSVMHLSGVTAG